MKKIKLDSGLYLTANKDGNLITVFLKDTINNAVMTNAFTLKECRICHKRIYEDNTNNGLCSDCLSAVKEYLSTETVATTKPTPKPRKPRKVKAIDKYKIHLSSNFNEIVIDNLTEIMNVVDEHVCSAERTAILLKLAICGLKYEKIAEILKITTASAKKYYHVLAVYGFIDTKNYSCPRVKSNVKYHQIMNDGNIKETMADDKNSAKYSSMKNCANKAFGSLPKDKEYTFDELCLSLNKSTGQIRNLLWIYKKDGKVEIIGKGKDKKYKFN